MYFTLVEIGVIIPVMKLTDEDRVGFESLLRREGYDGSVSARARIVLLRAEGHSAPKITRMSGTTKPMVYKWIARYEQHGVDGLSDYVSTGRPPKIRRGEGKNPGIDSAVTTGEDRTFALVEPGDGELSQMGDGNLCLAQLRGRIVARARSSTASSKAFKLSTDPDFEEKVIDVVALYLDPPMDAVVLSIDEKTQIQATGSHTAAVADDVFEDREAHP